MKANKINPSKLLNTQWTAVKPVNKERHFLVTKLLLNDSGDVSHCHLEAIMTQRTASVDWHVLQDSTVWRHGWK